MRHDSQCCAAGSVNLNHDSTQHNGVLVGTFGEDNVSHNTAQGKVLCCSKGRVDNVLSATESPSVPRNLASCPRPTAVLNSLSVSKKSGTCPEANVKPPKHHSDDTIEIKLGSESCTMALEFADGTDCVALVDSGAGVSVISQELIQSSEYLRELKPMTLPKEISFITGNKMSMWSNKVLTFDIFVDGHTIEMSAYILPVCGAFKMVIGYSTLQELRACLDMDKCLMKISNSRFRIRPSKCVKLLPGEAQLVRLKGDFPKGLCSTCMVMTPVRRLADKLPESSLIQFQDKCCRVLIKNTSSKCLKLHPKSIVGRVYAKSMLDMGIPLVSDVKFCSCGNNSSDCIPDDGCKRVSLCPMTTTKHPRSREGGAWSARVTDLYSRPSEEHIPSVDLNVDEISESRQRLRLHRLEKYPMVEEHNPDLYHTNEELLTRDISLDESLLDDDHKKQIRSIILDHSEAFSMFGETGDCKDTKVSISLQEEGGFFIRPFRYSEEDKEIIRQEIGKMVKQGILIRSPATHVSPLLLVKKRLKDGSMKYRVVIDYRKLNEKLVKPIYAQNLIQDAINRIGQTGAKFVSLIDLKDAYHALRLDEHSTRYTGVIPYYGSCTYKFGRLPQGLCVSGAEFTNEILNILSEIPNYEDFVINILDDIIILSETQDDHVEHFRIIVELFERHGLKISPKKTKIAHKSFSYMGYEIAFDEDGNPVMKIERSKIDAISKLPRPTTPRKVRSFIGMIQYLSRFIPKLNISLTPLYNLTKKSVKFKWTDEHQEVFDSLKKLVTEAPAISLPTRDGVYIMEADTSRIGSGAILKQIQDGEEKIIAFNSKKLPSACQSYSVSELEMSGILWNLKAFKALLGNKHFYVVTDHQALLGLLKSKLEPPTTRLARLIEKLMAYNFSIGYKKGKTLIVADYLSRHPLPDDDPYSKVKPIAFLEMSSDQAESTLNSIVDTQQTTLNALTRSQARAQKIDLPEVHKMGIAKRVQKQSSKKVVSPKVTLDISDDGTIQNLPPDGDLVTDPVIKIVGDKSVDSNQLFAPRPRRLIPQRNGTQVKQVVDTVVADRNALALFAATRPKEIIADFDETNAITSEEDTIHAITGIDDVAIDPETKLDIEKHLFSTDGLVVTDVVDPPSNDALTEAAKPLFDKARKGKKFSYRFSKQADIDPLLRVIDQRHLSQYRVGFSKQRLIDEIGKDARYGPIHAYLVSGKLPTKPGMANSVISASNFYFVLEDALFHYELTNDLKDMHYKLCIPKSMVRYILDAYHRDNVGSHLGITRTYATLNAKYHIHGLYRAVVNYVKSCDMCQQRKLQVGERKIIFPRELHEDLRPFQYFSCDLRNMNTSRGGHKYIFVAVCEVTHFVVAYPMKKPNARAIANLLLNKFIFVYGRPTMILFDLARYFCSNIMAFLSQAVGFKIKFIYRSQHHASRVERYMQSLKNTLITHLSGKAHLWPCFLDAAVYALNTFKSPALANFSPYELVYKHEPPPMDSFNLQPVTGICKDITEYISVVKDKFATARAMVQKYNAKKQDKQFIQSAREFKHKPIEVGQLCNLLNPENTKVFSSDSQAIRLHYVGPYICAARDKSGIFLEKLDGTYLSHPVYAARVKPVAIQTSEGSIISNKHELLAYLDTRDDLGASMLRNGLLDGKLRIVDCDGIPATMEDSTTSLSPMTVGPTRVVTPTPIVIDDPGRPLSDLNPEERKTDLQHRLNVACPEGFYVPCKARFKPDGLQICLRLKDSGNLGKHYFWAPVEENFNWEPVLDSVSNNDIKVTGNTFNYGFSKIYDNTPYSFDECES